MYADIGIARRVRLHHQIGDVLAARYRSLIKRVAQTQARVAVERSILVIIFHMPGDPTVAFADLDRDRRSSQLTCQLQALGYSVPLTTAA